MTECKGLIILGFGGHARSIADVALANGIKALLFIDENARQGETFLEFNVQKDFPELIPNGWLCMPAAGNNIKRSKQLAYIKQKGGRLATIVSKYATVGAHSEILPGSFIGHHVHIGPMVKIGSGCIINTGAIVEHESVVGDYSHVSVNSAVAGRSSLGKLVFLGAGATIIDCMSIVDKVTIGAGAVVIKSIENAGTYVGIPAKKIDVLDEVD